MSKKIIALLMVAMMLLSLAACGNEPAPSTTPDPAPSTTPDPAPSTTPDPAPAPEIDPDADKFGGDLIVNSGNVSSSMDTHLDNASLGNEQWMAHIYEAMAAQDANGEYYGEICDIDISADGCTVKLTLRDRCFSNGEKITMDDIEASLRRSIATIATEAAFNATWEGVTMNIEGDTLTFTMEKYNVNFMRNLFSPLSDYKIMPKSICDKYGFTGGTTADNGLVWGAEVAQINEIEDVIGSGPYTLTKWNGETEIVLTRNEKYVPITEGNEDAIGWCAPRKAYCDTITWAINTDAASRTASIMAHEVQIGTVQNAMKESALALGIQTYDTGTSWTHGIFFNLDESNADSPVADVNVRKAIRAAIDVNAVMLAIVNGDQSRVNLDPYAVTNNTVYASTAMEDSGEWNVANKELAKQYLAQSSYNGEPIVYLTHASGAFYNAAMAIIPMLEEIGLNIEFMPVDNGSHSAMRKDPATGHDIGCWEVQKREDNPVLHATFVTGSQGWWDSDAKSAAIDTMNSTPTGSAESVAAYNDYLQAVIDECPYILFGHPTGLGYKWPEVEVGQVGQTAYYWNSYFVD